MCAQIAGVFRHDCLQGNPLLCIYYFKLSSCCISQQAGVSGLGANPSLCHELIFTFAGEEILFLPAFSHVLDFHYALMRPCHLCSVDTLR